MLSDLCVCVHVVYYNGDSNIYQSDGYIHMYMQCQQA